MAMRKLLAVWGFLDLCLLAAGVLSIVATILFDRPNQLILNLVINAFDFDIGIVLGSVYLAAALLSLPAIMSSIHKPMMLKVFNMFLLICMAITLAFGTIVWEFSLRQIAEFEVIWNAQSAGVQQSIQDTFSCCGYFNGTAAGDFTAQTGFCADATFAANQTGCQTTITSATSPGSDFTLESIFSTIYGFEIILGGLFLTTVCVINERAIAVRFMRIDEKRGGGGFV